jgi:hypothetical protein
MRRPLRGYVSRIGVAIVAALGLGPSCVIPDPFVNMRITLGPTASSLCGLQRVSSDHGSQNHGDTIIFTIENTCVGPRWLGIYWEGQSPFESCHDFPMGRPFPVPEGFSWASCVMAKGDHCSQHRLFVQVRDNERFEVPASTPTTCVGTTIKNHSLDFQDVPP